MLLSCGIEDFFWESRNEFENLEEYKLNDVHDPEEKRELKLIGEIKLLQGNLDLTREDIGVQALNLELACGKLDLLQEKLDSIREDKASNTELASGIIELLQKKLNSTREDIGVQVLNLELASGQIELLQEKLDSMREVQALNLELASRKIELLQQKLDSIREDIAGVQALNLELASGKKIELLRENLDSVREHISVQVFTAGVLVALVLAKGLTHAQKIHALIAYSRSRLEE